MITIDQLRAIMPYCPISTAMAKIDGINEAMTAFGIDETPGRQAMYIAQVAQESGELRYVHEIADGSAYEGRADLGNTQPGDGPKYRGRGDLQITGRTNYTDCSLSVFGDTSLIANPEILEQPKQGSLAGAWFWQSRGLNIVADQGQFDRTTRVIVGGTTAAGQRVVYWLRAKKALGVA